MAEPGADLSWWARLVSVGILASLLAINLFTLLSSYTASSSSSSGTMKPLSSSSGSTAGLLLACAPFAAAALNITYYQPNVSLAPSPLPPAHSASDGADIVRLFQDLGRTTVWKSIANVTFEGDTFEPEGMVRLGDDRYVVSCGEYTAPTVKFPGGAIVNGTDRTPGSGFAHLIVFDGRGRRLADATLTAEGAPEYHNGGIDWDGEAIWGTIAQYRPNSTAYAYRADPATLEPREVLRYDDHLGGVVHDTRKGTVTALNWGSRNASTWDLRTTTTTGGKGSPSSSSCRPAPPAAPLSVVRNPSYFVDYQDCKWLGYHAVGADPAARSVMLCSGVTALPGGYNLGGLALVDVETMVPLAEVPVFLASAAGVRVTQNPVDVAVVDGRLRLYWLPDQHESTLYVYEAQPDSPFEYGGGPL